MIIAVKTEFFGLDTNGNRVTIAHFVGDSSADLPSLSAYTSGGVQITVGSTFHSVTDSADYEMTSAGVWVLSQPGQAAYTKAEVDALLSHKQDTLIFDSTPTADSTNPVTSGGVYAALASKVTTRETFGVGTTLEPTAENPLDLDSLSDPGRYQCGQSASANVTNLPITASVGFALEVHTNGLPTRFRQTMYFNSASYSGVFYERYYTSSGWSGWYRFEGTAV